MNSETGSEDPFDCIFMADNRYHCEAYKEGLAEGTRQGLLEGMSHGRMHGARFSTEVMRKRLRTLEALAVHIQAFPHNDPQHATLQQEVEKVRAKFRQVCSMMNVPADFREYVTVAAGVSF